MRYPASVAKLFWMVGFYGAVKEGIVTNESAFNNDLKQTIEISNNDAASRLLDAITDTKSGSTLQGEELENWLEKRRNTEPLEQPTATDHGVDDATGLRAAPRIWCSGIFPQRRRTRCG